MGLTLNTFGIVSQVAGPNSAYAFDPSDCVTPSTDAIQYMFAAYSAADSKALNAITQGSPLSDYPTPIASGVITLPAASEGVLMFDGTTFSSTFTCFQSSLFGLSLFLSGSDGITVLPPAPPAPPATAGSGTGTDTTGAAGGTTGTDPAGGTSTDAAAGGAAGTDTAAAGGSTDGAATTGGTTTDPAATGGAATTADAVPRRL